MEVVITAKNVSKIYSTYDNSLLRLKDALGLSRVNHGKDFYALDNVSFQLEKGKTLGIIGENGAGKSTLLKIITGVLQPTKGYLDIKGRVSALLELGIGFNQEYTGIENIFLSGNMMGIEKSTIESRVQSILDFADIGRFAYEKVKTYSSGMFARLAFSVAIHVDPDILIVDEALAVGDLFFQQKCNMYMKDNMEYCTKLLVTHDMASIANMADEVLVLSNGKMVFYGDPIDAIDYYTKSVHTKTFQRKKVIKDRDSTILEKNDEEVNENEFSGEDWITVSPKHLGGALDVRIEQIRILVNQAVYKGYVKNDDTVQVEMLVHSQKDAENIMVGYQMKDKYGNVIFGENSHSCHFEETNLQESSSYIIVFTFQWPMIQENDYFLTLGIGEGQNEMQHVIQCWAHSIFEFKNISDQPNHGLFNQRIDKLTIRKVEGGMVE